MLFVEAVLKVSFLSASADLTSGVPILGPPGFSGASSGMRCVGSQKLLLLKVSLLSYKCSPLWAFVNWLWESATPPLSSQISALLGSSPSAL